MIADLDDAGHLSINDVPLTGGPRRLLSRFDTGRTCELGTQPCEVFDLHLAAGLLPGLTVRHAAAPQRGPWPWWTAAPVAAVLVVVAFLLWRRARRTTAPC